MNQQDRDEFIVMKEDVKHIKEDVNEIKTNSGELNTNMTLIKSKLLKNDLTGEDGFFELTKRNGIRLTKAENKIVIGYGIVAGLFTLVGFWFKTVMK